MDVKFPILLKGHSATSTTTTVTDVTHCSRTGIWLGGLIMATPLPACGGHNHGPGTVSIMQSLLYD